MNDTLYLTCPDVEAVESYSQSFDDAWQAIEDAINKVSLMNDTLYKGDALVHRAPAADVALMRSKIRELKAELDCFENAREPSNLSPLLPGEIRSPKLLRDA